MGQQPPAPGGYAPRAQPVRGFGAPLLVGLVVGVAVGVGAGALLFGSDDGSGAKSAAADTKPIKLPDTLGGFGDLVAVTASKSNGDSQQVDRQRDHQAKLKSMTEPAYSKAFGGAAATYRAYSDSGLEKTPYVIAVRAEAPGLTLGPVTDPAYLRLATPDREVKTFGEVSCQILWNPPTLEGKTPDPASQYVLNCQRSGSGVTVFVGGSGFVGPADVQAMVGLTNAAWSAVSGG
jgi:hypothetical protein